MDWTWFHQLGQLEFWEGLLAGFENLGPLVPILLAAVESFFPPLPLVAIVALNVAAHGGVLGFLYSWAGVALGGIIMFLFWRRLIKRFFWKVASRSPKLEKAQQWVNRFDTSSLFMLSLLPFTPTSFMHFAFGMSDFDEKRYLRTVLLGKGLMVAMMAVFGQSLVSSLELCPLRPDAGRRKPCPLGKAAHRPAGADACQGRKAGRGKIKAGKSPSVS